MENLLNSHSALHNFKQAHGLNPVSANSVGAYLLERQLLRILGAEITPMNCKSIAKASGLTRIELEDLTEGKVYDLPEEALLAALQAYRENGLGACLEVISKAEMP